MVRQKGAELSRLQAKYEEQVELNSRKDKQIAGLENKVESLSRHSQSLAKTVQIWQMKVKQLQKSEKTQVEDAVPVKQQHMKQQIEAEDDVAKPGPPVLSVHKVEPSPQPRTPRNVAANKKSDEPVNREVMKNTRDDVLCPVCQVVLPSHRSQYAITAHVENCLRQKGFS